MRNAILYGAAVAASIAGVLVFPKSAHAGAGFSIVGGLSSTSVSATGVPEPAYGSGTSWSGGFLLELPFRNPRFSFDTGAIYANRKFAMNYPSQGVNVAATASLLEVPLLLRAALGSRFSVAAGPYLAEGLGGFAETGSAGASTASYSDAGVDRFDYGFMGSLRFTLKRATKLSVFMDARYYGSLGNLTASSAARAAGDSFKYGGGEILLGMHFGSN